MPPSSKPREPEPDIPQELQEEQIIDLPAREALSIVDPGVFGVGIPIGRTADQPSGPHETADTPSPNT